MTDLQHAKDFLAGLHQAAAKRSASGSNATNASWPATTTTPETPHAARENRFPANSSATRDMGAVLPARAVVALWTRFTHLYGDRWEYRYGPALEDGKESLTPLATTWARSLRGCSPEQLAAGLSACLERGTDRMVSLPEFWKFCHPAPKPMIHRELPALPKPSEQARAAGRRELAILRERLGLKAPDEVPAHA